MIAQWYTKMKLIGLFDEPVETDVEDLEYEG